MEQQAVEFEVVDYLRQPPDRKTLTDLVEMLIDDPADLVRADQRFKQLGLDSRDYRTGSDVVELLLRYPELMQRPVAVHNRRAKIGRPVERILTLLEEP